MTCIIHKWDGCRCKKCGKVRDTGHDWNGCKCRKCSRTRNEGHNYIYRPVCKTVSGQFRDCCEGECRTCGSFIYVEHDYKPAEKACLLRCTRCGSRIEKHDFKPVPGKCAEVCSICGEERDYLKIALNEALPVHEREYAVKKLIAASMLPEALTNNCAKGKHLWSVTAIHPQQFQGGASSSECTCVVCGKKTVEVDWGG